VLTTLHARTMIHTENALGEMKINELRALASRMSVSGGGKKIDLIGRIMSASSQDDENLVSDEYPLPQDSRHDEPELDRDVGLAEMDVTSSVASIEAIFDSCKAPHDNIATLPSRGIDGPLFEACDDSAALVTLTANMHISDDTDLSDDRNWILNEDVSTMKLRSLFSSMQVRSSVLFILVHFEWSLTPFQWPCHIEHS
jgi:hypothetical protein